MLTLFMIIAGIGLLLSLIVHVCSLFGLPCPFGEVAWALHVGIFVVWFSAVIVSNRLVKDSKQKDFWKTALRACPKWMRYMTYFFFVYAMLNFAIFIALVEGGSTESEDMGDTPTNVFRGFSGHWMAFYSAAMAILYSATHIRKRGKERNCPNGHPVGSFSRFCEECGEEIVEPENRTTFPQNQY